MSLLLDTHTFVWWVTKHPQLSTRALAAIQNEAGDCFISAATVYELTYKVGLGRFEAARAIADRVYEVMQANAFSPLPISLQHASVAAKLEATHRDPFDRILAAQAIVEKVIIVTADEAFAGLGAEVIW